MPAKSKAQQKFKRLLLHIKILCAGNEDGYCYIEYDDAPGIRKRALEELRTYALTDILFSFVRSFSSYEDMDVFLKERGLINASEI